MAQTENSTLKTVRRTAKSKTEQTTTNKRAYAYYGLAVSLVFLFFKEIVSQKCRERDHYRLENRDVGQVLICLRVVHKKTHYNGY
jgi:hypothetical protein